MKLTTILLSVAVVAGVACSRTQSQGGAYTVDVDLIGNDTTEVAENFDGKWAYLVNYDTSENVDSVIVENGKAKFSGTVEKPELMRLIIGNRRSAMFILEPGNITINSKGLASGTEGNEKFEKYFATSDSLSDAYATADNDSIREIIYNEYDAYNKKMLAANASNLLGYYIFVNEAYEYTPEQLDSALVVYPDFKQYKRITNLIELKQRERATAPGQKYTDFTVEGKKFSEMVEPGKYTLVDFWASWCGPCRREMPVIKELYEQYKDKGLNVVGVAVWDELADSQKAVEELQLPWPQMLNAQKIPTDIYGIAGIPHIMLLNPEGIIVARGMQGDSLRNVVKRAFTEAPVAIQ